MAISVPSIPPVSSTHSTLDARAGVAAAARGERQSMNLEQLAVLRFTGLDVIAFMHGQLSCDVAGLAVPGSTYGTYNSPKGRVLASFLLVRHADGVDMVLPKTVLPAIQKRLSMFVVRAKVQIRAADQDLAPVGLHERSARSRSEPLEGLFGEPLGGSLNAALGITAPSSVHGVVVHPLTGTWVALPGSRLLGLVPAHAVADVMNALQTYAPRAPSTVWDWLDIQSGIAFITPPVQDQIVAQMANFERIGAVSFSKGCYPGQEIVARTQHLGTIKRRMYRGHVAETSPPPQAGMPVYGTNLGDQAAGIVIAVAPGPDSGYDLLAVMHTSTAAANVARLGALDGAPITIVALPYSFE